MLTETRPEPASVVRAQPVRHQRPDIQGLRALAVVLVIANHVTAVPAGGFIGVDVFFVISGFLITGLLVRERERTGRISFVAFYRRRVRRILPAALVVTAVTVLVGFVAFARVRFDALVVDAIWATLFSANWRLVLTGTDYLHATDALSPLQHYWSLSVEEQFYFVWPVVLVITMALAARRKRFSAAVAISIIGVLSLAFGIWETTTHPTSAYFSTFSRAWELAAGALLALGSHHLKRIRHRARQVLLWGGLATILGSAVLLTSGSAFPAPSAAIPVLGAVALIASGTGTDRPPWSPLSTWVARKIGDASYSLYLWHFPVYVFATVYLTGWERRLIVATLVLTAVLAFASHRWIEKPFLTRAPRVRFFPPAIATAVMLSSCLITAIITPPAPAIAVQGQPVARAGSAPALDARWASVDAAAKAETWPKLTPSLDTIGADAVAPEWIIDGCLGMRGDTDASRRARWERCVYGKPDAAKVAVVVGDSISISWVPGLKAALLPLGYKVQVMSSEQCPAADVKVNATDGSFLEGCEATREATLARIDTMRPDLVFASETPDTIFRLADDATNADATDEWRAGAHRTLARLSAAAKRVFVLQAPPVRGGGPCATQRATPSQCLLSRGFTYDAVGAADQQATEGTSVTFVETSPWFCSAQGQCPSFVGESPVLADGEHLSAAQAKSLAGVLATLVS